MNNLATSPLPLTDTDFTSRFAAALQRGIDAWYEAGALLVAQLEKNPRIKDHLLRAMPQLDMESLNRLEECGRKQIIPELVVSTAPAAARLRKCPLSDQQRYIAEPMEVYVEREGKPDKALRSIFEMPPREAMQVFAGDRIRTLGEQRAWPSSPVRAARSRRPPLHRT